MICIQNKEAKLKPKTNGSTYVINGRFAMKEKVEGLHKNMTKELTKRIRRQLGVDG